MGRSTPHRWRFSSRARLVRVRVRPSHASSTCGSPGAEWGATDFRDVQTFVAVADAGGFRRAAAHWGVRQSVVSKRVRRLEDELGVSLFERHRTGVHLTPAGSTLRADLEPLLAQFDGALYRARAAGVASEGRLRVGVVSSLSSGFLRHLFELWLQEHPCVSLEINEAGPREHLGAVMNRRIDVTFITGLSSPPGCDVEHLWTDRVVAALPAKRASELCGELLLRQLAEDRFIVGQGGVGTEIRDYIVRRLSDLGISPQVEIVPVSREVLLTMVGLGLGVTLTSTQETGTAYPNVAFRPVVDGNLPFSAVWSPENDNPALRRFLSLARVLAKREAFGGAPSRTLDRSP